MLVKKNNWLLEILALLIISTLVYALDIGRYSFFRDDWYYAYDGYVAGPSIFHTMFSSDRPVRGLFFEILFTLFGPRAIYYHVGSYLWRLLGSICALWLFRILWPRQQIATFIAASLFLTYPGYLWWVAGIEYLPMVVSVCLHIVSIALTLKAIQTSRRLYQVAFVTGTTLTGWGALALVDYAIGMEIFRILCIGLLVIRDKPGAAVLDKLKQVARKSIVPLIIPVGFLFWRLFFFEGSRQATDIHYQLSFLLQSPLQTILLWMLRLFQSSLNVLFLAWGVPFGQNFFGLQIEDALASLLVAIVVVLVFIYVTSLLRNRSLTDSKKDIVDAQQNWGQEAILLGVLGVISGVLPVVLTNRYVAFQAFSHYALPASIAAAVLMMGLLDSLKAQQTQILLASLLIGIATLTHRAISLDAVKEGVEIHDFWWQVHWRIPSIKAGTTLAVDYTTVKYSEDNDIVLLPANFLYFPERYPGTDLVKYKIAAVPLTQQGVLDVIMEDLRISRSYRSHRMFLNCRKVLVISQPSIDSCVHVRNEDWPEISNYDSASIIAMAPHSKIEQIGLDIAGPEPLDYIFGTEPSHTWCYYYQNADLARQQSDWETVAALGDDAISLGYSPKDLVEWMPFLQAYAYTGNIKGVDVITSEINNTEFYRLQVCKMPALMEQNGYPLSEEMATTINDLYCQSKK